MKIHPSTSPKPYPRERVTKKFFPSCQVSYKSECSVSSSTSSHRPPPTMTSISNLPTAVPNPLLYPHYPNSTTIYTHHTTVTQSRFVQIIRELQQNVSQPMSNPSFQFERSPSAALHNANILRLHNFDWNVVISAHHPGQISHGSEFQSSSDLEELCNIIHTGTNCNKF